MNYPFRQQIAYLFKWQVLSLLLMDYFLLPLALFTAVWLRLGAEWDYRLNAHLWIFLSLPLWSIPIFIQLGLYRAVIKFVDDRVVYIVFSGVSVSVLVLSLLLHLNNINAFPRTAIIIYWLFALAYIGGSRFIMRGILRNIGFKPAASMIAIYGAGAAGVQLASSLSHSFEYSPVFFIDDEQSKWQTLIRGLKVYPPFLLKSLCLKYEISAVLLAIPSASKTRRREIIQSLAAHSIYVKTLPSMASIVSGEVKFSDIKTVEIEDLLGRAPVAADYPLLSAGIYNKQVLVTGCGGSIGSELCRQVASLKPTHLVLFDNSEYLLYLIEHELRECYPYLKISAILGSVCNEQLIKKILADYTINTLYHAAAYKHVPMMEANILAGLENNVLGTYITAAAANAAQIERMILISTDKAVRPTNVMGASKRLAELVMQGMAQVSSKTIFSMVRFGNVLGSSGSVVPLFKKQISQGGPLTVTHPDIIRYFMTIAEAVELVIQAGNMAQGGEVFVLDMGEPIKIVDLAKKMIYLSGLSLKDHTNLTGDIEIKYTGLRAGEKLYEELLIGENPTITDHLRIMKANEDFIELAILKTKLAELADCVHSGLVDSGLSILKELVPEYKTSI